MMAPINHAATTDAPTLTQKSSRMTVSCRLALYSQHGDHGAVG